MKNYNNAYMAELTEQELVENNGGIWEFIAGAIIGGMIYDIVCHPRETLDSFNAGRDMANEMWNK